MLRNKTFQKCHLFIIYKFISDNSAAWTRPGSRVARLWIFKFVINKQMVFFLSFVSQQLLFLFSKHLNTMLNVTNCGTGRTDLWFEVRVYQPPKPGNPTHTSSSENISMDDISAPLTQAFFAMNTRTQSDETLAKVGRLG